MFKRSLGREKIINLILIIFLKRKTNFKAIMVVARLYARRISAERP